MMTNATMTLDADVTHEADEFDPFGAGQIEQSVASTESQREVWLGDRLSPEASLAYNESMALRLQGALDVGALGAAVDRLVARHQSLRATFSADGTQLLIGEALPVGMVLHDLCMLDAPACERAIAEACSAAVRLPFSLEHGPLFRAALYKLTPTTHQLLLTAHHAVCDGWSWGVIGDELPKLYAEQLGEGPALAPASRYTDYAAWETAEAGDPAMQDHVAYWLDRFAGSNLPVLDLPLDHRRPAVRTFRSRRIDHHLDAELLAGLRRTGSAAGSSLFATMFGGFATLMHRITAQDDLVIGIAAAGQLASDMPGLVGHCVNLLPLRVPVDAQMPFDALVRASGRMLLDAFEHQTLTYGTLLKKLPVQRDPSRLPLVSVLFNVDPDVASGIGGFPGLEVTQRSIPRVSENFELFFNVASAAGGMCVEVQYNADLFDEATVRRWLEIYEHLLAAVVSDSSMPIGRLPLLSPGQAAATAALQPAGTPLAGAPLMQAAFCTQAARTPERAAVRCGDKRVTYGELDARSNQLARLLRQRGIGRGQLVGLCLPRDCEMLVALLAVLKSGAAYVPLDPDFPQARLDYYAHDAQLAALLTRSDVTAAPRAWRDDAAVRVFELDADRAWEQLPATAVEPSPLDAQADDPAYVIYTSGSTGKPKGVAVPHGSVANFLQSMQREPGIVADDKLVAVTTLSFDIAVLELLLPLTVGAEVVIAPREVAMNGGDLAGLLESTGATLMQATPGMWRLLLDGGWKGRKGFKVLVGGESLPPGLADELTRAAGEVWNMYGPTETTIWSTLWRVDPAMIGSHGISIGKPIDNTTVWILDEHLQQMPVGVPGEICIGGLGVTLGYLHRPELTADRFVCIDIDGVASRVYRTGDRGRWRNNGLLEHMGRLDFQVKVRGYRIELGEIESRCNEAPGVARSVVITREDQPGDVRLVAYLAPAPGVAFDSAALDRHLRIHLPQYMLPQHVVMLDAIPQLPNGKVDRKALPAPQAAAPRDSGARLLPRTPREQSVLAIMEQVLSLPGLGIRDDFFALGGHSLLAARLTTLLSRESGVTIPLRTLFEAPTAEQLAAAIDALSQAGVVAPTPIRHLADRRSAPLSPMQERIRFVEELHPGRSVYNAPSAQRLEGPLDVGKFKATLEEIIRRQPALRTSIGRDPETGAPAQLIAPSAQFELPLIDLQSIPADQREAELAERMQALADEPIDIRRAPLFHAAVFRMAPDDHAFVFVPHHLVWDGWSFDILQSELVTIYSALVRGEPHGLPELTASLGDFTQWYSDWLQSPAFEQQLRYWKTRFASAPMPRALNTDMPRKAGMSGQGGTLWITVNESLTERLRVVARDHGVTLSMLTLGIYLAMMGRVVGGDAIVIAMPVRGREAAELEPVMGFFNNVLPLSFQVDQQMRMGDFLRYVKHELLAVMNHQQVPFERLASEPEFAARAKGNGLYQALFSFQDARERPRGFGGLRQRQMHLLQRGATDDIGIWLMDKPTGIEGAVMYNADIYRRSTAIAFRERYLELLQRVADDSDMALEAFTAPGSSPHAADLERLAAGSVPRPATGGVAAPAKATTAAMAPLLLPEQARLAQIWASALNIDVNDIRASDNFFDLGGDSLMAMNITQQAEQVLGFRAEPRRYIFENLGQLAATPPANAAEPDAGAAAQTATPTKRGLLGRVLGWGRKD